MKCRRAAGVVVGGALLPRTPPARVATVFRFVARHALASLALAFLVVYFGTYYYLSRRGADWCRQYNCYGFYYALPHDGENWGRWHDACNGLFRPANALDRFLGSELHPAACAGFGLSK